MLHPLLLNQIAESSLSWEQLPPGVQDMLTKIGSTYSQYDDSVATFSRTLKDKSAALTVTKRQLKQLFIEKKVAEQRQKALVEKLSENTAQLRSIFENATDPLLLSTRDLYYIDCNAAALKILGLTDKSELINKHRLDITPEFQSDGTRSREKCRKTEKSAGKDGSHHFIWTHKTVDDIPFQVGVTIIPVTTQNLLLVRWCDLTSQNKIEQLLKEEEQYRILLKYGANVPGAIYQLERAPDNTFSLPFTSPGIADIFEFPQAQLAAKPELCMERIEKTDQDTLWATCKESYRHSKVWEYSFRVNLPTKGLRWISGSAKPERLPSGNITWNGYLNDITDKKEAEELLKKSEAQFRDIFENTDELIQNIRLSDGRFIYVNPAWLNTLEYKGDDLSKLMLKDIIHNESFETFAGFLGKDYDGREVDNIEAVFASKTGKKIFVQGRVGCHFKNGLPVSLRGIFRNVTQTKIAAEIILREKELSNSIINNLPGIIYLCDSQGKMIRWNRNFETLNNYTAAEIANMHPFNFYDEQSLHMIAKLDEGKAAARLSGAEVIMLTKDKTQMHFFINAALIQYEGSRCRLVMGIDISKRKRAEELLIQSYKELEHNNDTLKAAQIALDKKAEELAAISRYKSEFLANMSHELRTPLNSIMILSKILQDNKSKRLSPKEVQFAEVIQKSGADLLHLINEVLDLAKVESGTIDLNIKEHSLHDFIKDIRLTWTAMAIEKQIKFNIKIDRNVTTTIQTDIGRLGQIIRNLLSNAFKFTQNKGTVTLRITNQKKQLDACRYIITGNTSIIQLQVKDTGIGIPLDKQELVFMAFQQADGTTKRKYGGTGLGLSISRELVRQLGGEIILKSEEGKGSIFYVCLPIG